MKVGNGLKVTSGAVGVDPLGEFTALNMGVTGVKLTAGADLDALPNGVWRCDTSDLAATVLHKPPVATTDLRAFTVLEYGTVEISSSVSRYGVQLFTTNPSSGTAEIFLRHRGYSGGWQPWQRAGETPVVPLTGAAVTRTLAPNVQHVCSGAVTSLDLSFGAANAGTVPEYSVLFTSGASLSVSVPASVRWAVTEPVWLADSTYLLTFLPAGGGYLGLWSVTA